MKLQIFILTFLFALNAFAGGESGGGVGLNIKGKIQVLDLLEAGVEDHPFFDPSVKADENCKKRVLKAISSFSYSADLLCRKLTEIHKLEPDLVFAILNSFERYNWQPITMNLVYTKDVQSTVKYDPKSVVQLAVRNSRRIQVVKEHWAKLTAAHQVALMLHEALYSVSVLKYPDATYRSSRTREFTGYLFTKDFLTKGRDGLKTVASDVFPTGTIYEYYKRGEGMGTGDAIRFRPELTSTYLFITGENLMANTQKEFKFTKKELIFFATSWEHDSFNTFVSQVCTQVMDIVSKNDILKNNKIYVPVGTFIPLLWYGFTATSSDYLERVITNQSGVGHYLVYNGEGSLTFESCKSNFKSNAMAEEKKTIEEGNGLAFAPFSDLFDFFTRDEFTVF